MLKFSNPNVHNIVRFDISRGKNRIPGYNEDNSSAFLNAVSDVSTNGSTRDPVPLVDDQAESMLLLQVEPPASSLLVPHEHSDTHQVSL